jgi:hypothetical protein
LATYWHGRARPSSVMRPSTVVRHVFQPELQCLGTPSLAFHCSPAADSGDHATQSERRSSCWFNIGMRPIVKSWLMTAAVICTTLIVNESLASSRPLALYSRVALVIGLATALTWYWRSLSSARMDPEPSAIPRAPHENIPPTMDENLVREVALAIEHIRSIRVLLEISRAHRQPIPPAVPHNLALVAKHLENAQQQLTGEPVIPLGSITHAVARAPSIRLTASVPAKE